VGEPEIQELVAAAGRAAKGAAASLARADGTTVTAALRGMAERLASAAPALLAANEADVEAAVAGGMAEALIDRLRLGEDRLRGMVEQILTLADTPDDPVVVSARELADGTRVEERRRPVGVIGANYEARPNVTVDVASQLLKSRNAGVLRTGGAALRSAAALLDEVIRPACAAAGVDPDAIQLVRTPDRSAALALCSLPGLIPLVILRGSGETTATLATHAAANGVRTLAHAEGGGVLYVDAAADRDRALALVSAGLDRLGVCNRLNLLLVAESRWDELQPVLVGHLEGLGIRPSLPPHGHPRGHEWALDDGNEATVTLDRVPDARAAAAVANEETSGLAATIVTEDPAAAREFLAAYAGTGAFWNVTTRLLDGFKLLAAPETGINVDHVPGPRGPVTFRDLNLRQYVVLPPAD
jgi:glutamate-5-semialdehyde dehydrogenase